MTSTGSSLASTTGTSPMCTVFHPTKPIMGGLVQIKSDTFAASTGGPHSADWTNLKISSAEPQQSSQICPMLDMSGAQVWTPSL